MEEPKLFWYALKVFYNKVFDMEALLNGMGLETYIAVDKVLLKGEAHLLARRHLASLTASGQKDTRYIQEGALIYQRAPIITSLIFVRAEETDLPSLEKALKEEGSNNTKGFIYKNALRKEYARIPDNQMSAFRLVTARGSEGLGFYSDDEHTHYKEGGRVRVIGGPFKGAEGYIKRIKRDRRLLVNIEGIVAVVTSYIDPQYLEIVKE